MTFEQAVLPAAAAFFGGAINSVAGGGSFLTFPALIFAGVPPIPANATNNAAMWVGTIGGARGYWKDVREHKRLLISVASVSSVGALLGAVLLLRTPAVTFAHLIPWLLLFATGVFAASPLLTRHAPDGIPSHSPWQIVLQFFVSIYGGYFGAGMGILMLAILTFTGLPSFNATNGMKNVLSVVINGMALIPFLLARIIDWRFALPMAVIALMGGYFGAKFFRRVPATLARVVVITIGIAMTIAFFIHN
ncbi:MAG: sulfite exporter TauE/SafE family protein [Vulcanimicrobiaceae bacterium]